MKKALIIGVSIILIVAGLGCALERSGDGNIIGIGWDPKVKQIADDVAESAGGLTDILMYFSPIAAGGLAATLATWKKMSKTSIKFKRPLEFYVKTLEKIKNDSPEVWDAIKKEIKSGKPTSDIEASVRGILDGVYES